MAIYEAQCSKVGSFAYSQYFKLYVDLTEVEVNVGNNTSKIQYHVYCQSSGSGSINANHFKYFNINGQTIINTTEKVNVSSPNAYILIASGTTAEILHNADGSKTVPFSAEIKASSYGVSASLSNNFTLSTIPRASTPTLSGTMELGQTITIHTNRASTSFTHHLYYTWGTNTWQLISTGVGDSYQWTIPKSFANFVPNSVSGSGGLICETYSGSTLIGTTSIPITIYVPDTDEFRPSISKIYLAEAVEGIREQFGAYIQNQSKLNYEVTANGAYSSTIASYKVVVNGTTYNSSSGTTDILKLSGTNSIVVTVTDSRGRKDELTEEFEVVEYVSPTITQFTANRCDEDGAINEEGEYAKIEISATITRLSDNNAYTYFLQYKKGEDQEYDIYNIELTEVKTDTDVTIAGSVIIPANGDYSFDYMFLVSDYFIQNINKTADIGTAFQLFNWKANGRGFAIGKVSEKDAFEVNLDTYIEKNIYDKNNELIVGGLQGVVLYDNPNGDNGSNFTLNDTISNYKEVKIDYVVSMGSYIINESKRTPITDGNCVSLTCFMAHSNIVQLLDIGRYLFSGNTLTKVYETRSRISEDNTAKWDGASTGIYITKITGYKY